MTRTLSNRKSKAEGSAEPTWEPLADDELAKTHAYWRACNYLAAGMIYLRDNPLLRKPLKPEHIKVRLLGHWGASPGLSFTYVHLNRLINKFDLNAIFLAGPGQDPDFQRKSNRDKVLCLPGRLPARMMRGPWPAREALSFAVSPRSAWPAWPRERGSRSPARWTAGPTTGSPAASTRCRRARARGCSSRAISR